MQISIFITDYLGQDAQRTFDVQAGYWPFLNEAWAKLADWRLHPIPSARLSLTQLSEHTLADSKALQTLLQYQAFGRVDGQMLMLSPVHLALQRDTFSLQAQLALEPHEYAQLTDVLQSHFAQDFTLIETDTKQYWWLKPKRDLSVHLPWVGDYLYANAHAWNHEQVSYGEDAALVRGWVNEMQMLLHGHNINLAREASGQLVVNSLWLSQGASFARSLTAFDTVMGHGTVFEGLRASGLSKIESTPLSCDSLKSKRGHVALVLDDVAGMDWDVISQACKAGWLKKMTVTLPWGHQSVSAHYHAWQRFNPLRWRDSRGSTTVLNKLAQLQQGNANG